MVFIHASNLLYQCCHEHEPKNIGDYWAACVRDKNYKSEAFGVYNFVC
jgi:hypothetical protein